MFPPRRVRRGFIKLLAVELLVVVALIGILAAIAIPKFGSTITKAHFAGMETDLHNLVTAQEAFYSEHSRYAKALDSLKFNASPGDSLVMVEATSAGWSATASHTGYASHFCAMSFGTIAPVAPATAAGLVACQ